MSRTRQGRGFAARAFCRVWLWAVATVLPSRRRGSLPRCRSAAVFSAGHFGRGADVFCLFFGREGFLAVNPGRHCVPRRAHFGG